ncbi:MAG TPA: hypothetical protein VM052_08390, partial [Candidatus Limnocylindrales bacterium]|nr:hypothetical protein [Candidatus Limnocylindrales bacterium]
MSPARKNMGRGTSAAAKRTTRKPPTRRRVTNASRGRKVRVAIIGVGNCASSIVQGVHYYRDAKPGDDIPGLMHV